MCSERSVYTFDAEGLLGRPREAAAPCQCPSSCYCVGRNSTRYRDSAKHSRCIEVTVSTHSKGVQANSKSESCQAGLGGGFYQLWVRGRNGRVVVSDTGVGRRHSSSQSLLSGRWLFPRSRNCRGDPNSRAASELHGRSELPTLAETGFCLS